MNSSENGRRLQLNWNSSFNEDLTECHDRSVFVENGYPTKLEKMYNFGMSLYFRRREIPFNEISILRASGHLKI